MTRSLPFAATLAALLLGGCISLLPKTKPAQLYRFGLDRPPASQAAPSTTPRFAVQELVLGFDRASATDRILTVTGDQAAYIKGARWVTGAPMMFEDAVNVAFDADPGPARLMARGEATRPDLFLKLDVRTFEARYDHGQGAAPTVVVRLYAALTRPSERTLVGEKLFEASAPASENGGAAIAAAFNQATNQVLNDLVHWVDNRGAG